MALSGRVPGWCRGMPDVGGRKTQDLVGRRDPAVNSKDAAGLW